MSNKTILKSTTIILLLLSGIIIAYLTYNDQNQTSLYSIGLLIIGYPLTQIIDLFIKYFSYLKIIISSKFHNKIRISFAHLIRIKYQNKYLLVKSRKFDLFQPPGGVYHYYDKNIEQKYHLDPDEYLDNVPPEDLRKVIRKTGFNLGKLLFWFFSQNGRETSPHREFYEELILTSILPDKLFKTPSFKFVSTKGLALTKSKEFDVHELKLFDIFEFVPDAEQITQIESLIESDNTDLYCWMDSGTIRRNGYNRNTKIAVNIGSQTKYIL